MAAKDIVTRGFSVFISRTKCMLLKEALVYLFPEQNASL